MSRNQISGVEFGIISLGIKCLELSLESQVLESNVQNWFSNHVSCNHMSGIRCPELILELHVLESGVQNWSRNYVSCNHMSGIRCPDLHCNQVSGNCMPFITCLGIRCPIWLRN